MLATFCLRLACGLIASLCLLSRSQINPRFYRVHFLTGLGLSVVTALFLREEATPALAIALGCAISLTFIGSVVWSLDRAPGGRAAIAATLVALATALGLLKYASMGEQLGVMLWGGEASSAVLLGVATTAMLVGHSYLIAPAMSLVPLFRLLGTLIGSLLIRGMVATFALWCWTREETLANLNEVTLLLSLRWGLGILLPLVLGAMAWQTARIRSTQSATGILYVVVIFCFLGELAGQLLQEIIGLPL